MYQAPDFVKVDVKVRNSLAASGCPYDQGTNYTVATDGSICTDGGETQHELASYIELMPGNEYQCYSTFDE